MICPKCGAELDDDSDFCYSCKMKFEHSIEKENDTENMNVEIIPPEEKQKKDGRLNKTVEKVKNLKHKKLVLIIIITLVSILCLFIVFYIGFKGNPEKIADKMSDKIGSNISEVAKAGDVSLVKQSSSKVVNEMNAGKLISFDYIYESDKMILVDGYNVPEYIIGIKTTDNSGSEVVDQIYYRDYRYQKKNYKGKEKSNAVSFDQIVNKKTLDDIKETLDIKPTSILFKNDKTAEYTFRFCFENDDQNLESREFIVTVDSKDNVLNVLQTQQQNFYNNIK